MRGVSLLGCVALERGELPLWKVTPSSWGDMTPGIDSVRPGVWKVLSRAVWRFNQGLVEIESGPCGDFLVDYHDGYCWNSV